jgi:hypothetical protein
MARFQCGVDGTLQDGGLATNLHALGVRDTIIQRILRHSNVSVTMMYYAKPLAQDVADGMAKLEQEFNEKTAEQASRDNKRAFGRRQCSSSYVVGIHKTGGEGGIRLPPFLASRGES